MCTARRSQHHRGPGHTTREQGNSTASISPPSRTLCPRRRHLGAATASITRCPAHDGAGGDVGRQSGAHAKPPTAVPFSAPKLSCSHRTASERWSERWRVCPSRGVANIFSTHSFAKPKSSAVSEASGCSASPACLPPPEGTPSDVPCGAARGLPREVPREVPRARAAPLFPRSSESATSVPRGVKAGPPRDVCVPSPARVVPKISSCLCT